MLIAQCGMDILKYSKCLLPYSANPQANGNARTINPANKVQTASPHVNPPKPFQPILIFTPPPLLPQPRRSRVRKGDGSKVTIISYWE